MVLELCCIGFVEVLEESFRMIYMYVGSIVHKLIQDLTF